MIVIPAARKTTSNPDSYSRKNESDRQIQNTDLHQKMEDRAHARAR